MDLGDFKIKKLKDDKFTLTYKGKTFIGFNARVLLNIISDNASKTYLSKLVNLTKGMKLEPIDDEILKKAAQLERAYTTRRKKHHRNKNLKSIDKKSKDFHHFVKALDLCKVHKVNYNTFLDAQIDGLSFINDGAGVFPSLTQISNAGAEERLLSYTQSDREENDPENVKRLELNYSDKNTALNENPTYQARYQAMKKGTASLQHAYFVYDCQTALKGFATDFVSDYIEERID